MLKRATKEKDNTSKTESHRMLYWVSNNFMNHISLIELHFFDVVIEPAA